jgi:hypothetical protein
MVKAGAIGQDEHAWHEGLTEWQPLNKIISFATSDPAFPQSEQSKSHGQAVPSKLIQKLQKPMTTSTDEPTTHEAKQLISRYRDAYLVAKVTIGLGGSIKALGWLIALITLFVVVGIGSEGLRGYNGGAFWFLGVFIGAIQVTVFYFFGILVAAVGQILRASLDTAVNTTPLLTEGQKAMAMSL